MYLETSQIFQITAALIGAIVILVAAYAAPLKVSVAILLLFIPFQPVDTRFGSANVVITYVLFGALLLRGRLKFVPMLGAIFAVILAYLLTISQLPRALYIEHGLVVFFLISGFLVFILAYNLAREVESPRYIINLFITANVVAVFYCLVQFSIGPGEKLIFFGSEDLWMHRNRGGGDPRLVGPFGTPGLTAAYFMSMTVMLTYEIINSKGWRKIWLLALGASNIAMIIGTANRGSFLVLLVSLLGFLFVFRAQLGLARVIQILVATTVLLVATSAIVVAYTDFGIMFSRLENVAEFEEGMPDSRRVAWPRALAVIPEKLWLGHGPRIVQDSELRRRNTHPEQLAMPYAHNLYLHLMVTVGIVGTLCMLYFLVGVAWRVYQGARLGTFRTTYEKGWVVVGVLVIVGFLIDEIKIEFLRPVTVDYAHFVFALFGIFLGWADRARATVRAGRESMESEDSKGKHSHVAPVIARRVRT